VLDENSAIFCPPDDVDAWHTALTRLLADEGLRENLAKNAYAKIKEFAWLEREKKILE
jgi:glycosyltransferase involved in cell wall biosynthesis